ncbi:MAG: DAK2 domain-containing protein, partial [Defluviitaleaceae bacterium]|nr:DAK2 domain-containing protein [Defluviitaleaceae bacterium]
FSLFSQISHEEITFGYCTEFFILFESHNKNFADVHEENYKQYLETMGDSIVVVSDDDLVKVHIHTDHPGLVLEKSMAYGQLSDLKIDNMRLQHSAINSENSGMGDGLALSFGSLNSFGEEKRGFGIVAVCSGSGFKEIFRELGVNCIIDGGKTMNPSSADIAAGINEIEENIVFVLPNNKNVILAAKQAVYLCPNKQIHIIESQSLPQGITALVHSFSNDIDELHNLMQQSLSTVKTGQITLAVRDTQFEDKDIREGDYICLLDGRIIFAHKTLKEAAFGLLDAMIITGDEILGIFPGDTAEDFCTQEIMTHLENSHPRCEIDIRNGNQPIYHYIFSAE